MKKTISLILIVMLFASGVLKGFAASDERETNQERIASYVESFVKTMCKSRTIKVDTVFEIFDENDELSGYSVDLLDDKTHSGYVIVKFINNQPVVSEFCTELGAKNPFVEIITQSKISLHSKMVFYSIGPNVYHILNNDTGNVFGFEGEISLLDFSEYKNHVKDIKNSLEKELNYSSLDGWSVISDTYSGTFQEGATITDAACITYYASQDVSNINQTYACSVVALSNMMKYYRFMGKRNIDSSFSTLYNSLWNYAGTSSTGATSNGNEPPAAVSYMSSKGYSIEYDNYWWDFYSDFVRDIKAGRPILFSYGAYFGNIRSGHTVFCVGYVKTSDYNYLRVADGWNNYLRYINFNGYNYLRKDGWSFTKP